VTDLILERDDLFTGPPVDDVMIARAEQVLGRKLPDSYIDLLWTMNGGTPQRRCLPTRFATSWADDHFEIRALLGIGGECGIDAQDGFGSAYLVAEWEYPDIGIVICDTPSGGHDTVMLDYRECGPRGEPSVAYIDEDRVPRTVAESFDNFLESLVVCSSLSEEK
jgi:hypothetical protein